MGQLTEQKNFKGSKNGQQIHEEILNIPSNKRNANQTHVKILPHSCFNTNIINTTNNNKYWQGCGEKEPSYTVGGNAN
jgi:hypothetical protein